MCLFGKSTELLPCLLAQWAGRLPTKKEAFHWTKADDFIGSSGICFAKARPQRHVACKTSSLENIAEVQNKLIQADSSNDTCVCVCGKTLRLMPKILSAMLMNFLSKKYAAMKSL